MRKITEKSIDVAPEANNDATEKTNPSNDLPMTLDSMPVNQQNRVMTNKIKRCLRNACNGHQYKEMASSFGVKTHTLRTYVKRKKIIFINRDPTKCYFCSQSTNKITTNT